MTLTLRLEGLEIWGYHGCYPEEKEKGGPFEIDILIQSPEPDEPLSDQLELRVDYEALTNRVAELFNQERFKLIEPLTAKLAEAIIDEFELVDEVTVTIRKLSPPMPQKISFAAVSVTRSR